MCSYGARKIIGSSNNAGGVARAPNGLTPGNGGDCVAIRRVYGVFKGRIYIGAASL